MKSVAVLAILLAGFMTGKGQKIDSIVFHLYTDSLKKGTYNYISIDGKLSNGRWLPLTSKEVLFTASAGRFEGNSLFIAKYQPEQRVIIKTVLKADTTVAVQAIIYIKKNEETEPLRTESEIMRRDKSRKQTP